jgi:hypothetical protein
VHFPPIENGLDYLCSVVDHLVKTGDETPGPRDLKYAVLHLQAAVEVLLKARLQAEDWTLVFKVPSTAARAKFESAEFESCSTGETLARLRNIVGLEFAEKDVTALNNLRGDRNALQHYGLTVSGPAIEARAGHVLDFLVGFLDEQLLSTLDASVVDRLERDYTGRIRSGLGEIRAFVKNRMNRLRPELDPWSPCVVQCHQCNQFALLVDGQANRCHFCGIDWGEQAAPGLAGVLGTFRTPVRCPGCGENELVRGVVTAYRGEEVHLCFACSEEFGSLAECAGCELPFVPQEEESLCSTCFDEEHYSQMQHFYAVTNPEIG